MSQLDTVVPLAQLSLCERVRIAFVIDAIDDWQAGTEQQVRKLLGALDRTNFEPTLYFLRPSLHLRPEDFPCPVHVANWRPQVKWYRPTALAALVRSFRRWRPHIVQTFFRDGTYYGTLAAKIVRVPTVVISVRNAGYWKGGIDHLALKTVYRFADFFQCNSRSVAESLMDQNGTPPARIEVLPNAIDLNHFAPATAVGRLAARKRLGLPLDAPVFVSVANLRPVKDLSTLIEAAGLVRRDLPTAQFLLIGEGPLRPALESQASNLSLSACVRFLGAQADVRPFLAAADLGLLTSRSEASSNAVLEYMAMGLPAVLSDIPGNRDLVDGVFFEPGNAADLARKILGLWHDPDLRQSMHQDYCLRGREHSLEAFSQRAEAYYEGLVVCSYESGRERIRG
jgi:glycosyltransferase involved in cell wall biosynthesis